MIVAGDFLKWLSIFNVPYGPHTDIALPSCYAATIENLMGYTYINGTAGVGATLTAGSNGTFTVDSVSPPLNSFVLVKNQTTAAQNGIYNLTTAGDGSTAAVLTRSSNYNTAQEINNRNIISVINGTVNSNTGWLQIATVTTVGTDPILYSQFGVFNGIVMPNQGGTGVNNGSNTLTITANSFINQDLRTIADVTFNLLTLTNPLNVAGGGTGQSEVDPNTLLVGSNSNQLTRLATQDSSSLTTDGSGNVQWTGLSATSGSGNVMARDANGNTFANNYIPGFLPITSSGGTTTLTAASPYYIYITGTQNHTIVMPVATTMQAGQNYRIINVSTGTITVTSSGANNIQMMETNTVLDIECVTPTGTTAASWGTLYSFTSAGNVNSGTALQIAYYAADGRTLSGNPYFIVQTNVGVQIGTTGVAGGVLTCLSGTANTGQLSFACLPNTSGNFSTAIFNSTTVGQNQTITIPDSKVNNAFFMVSQTAAGAVPILTAFTPSLQFGGASSAITYSTQEGYYTRSSNIIQFAIHLVLSSKGSSTGGATIAGMPFAANVLVDVQNFVASYNGITFIVGGAGLVASIAGNTSFLSLYQQVSVTGATQLDNTMFSATTEIIISGSYMV